jgi:RNA polymerase sigma factor (sigma-70 family)
MATANMSDFLHCLTRGMAAEMLADHSDRQLVESALTGRDQAAFHAIVHRHGPMVYRVCWRVLQHQHDAEDSFQATFLILAQKLHTMRKHASLASWLHGVAHRVALKAKAQSAAQRRREHRTSPPDSLPPDDVTWAEFRTALDVELSQLPDKWRLPLILCYMEGRTQEESASQLGWSTKTLRRRLEEARDALGCRLMRRGIAWSAALSAVLLSDCIASASPASGLVASTIEAAASIAAGETVAMTASANVTALVEGVMKAMFMTKIKIATTVLLLALFGFGTALMMNQIMAAELPAKEYPARRSPETPLGEQVKNPAKAPKSLAFADYLQSSSWTLDQVNLEQSTISISDRYPGIHFRVKGKEPHKNGGALEGLAVAKDAQVFLNGRAAKLTDLETGMFLTLKMVQGKTLISEIHAIAVPAPAQYMVEKVDLKKNTIVLRLDKSDTIELPLAKDAKVIIEMHNVPGVPNPQISEGKMIEIVPGTPVRLEMRMEEDRLVVRSVSYVTQ